ncbi:MAG: redoxin family protein [Acaryochloridaceae cyanobacterium SU_2_1]|nr:redoxin family protein [Acaryochloridaceae cyanobacterium SU_2_1]
MTTNSSSISPNPDPQQPKNSAKRLRNFLVVLAAIALSILLVLGSRQQSEKPSLSSLAVNATPLDIALTNNKPTLLEFYANWCTTCQAMADDIKALEDQYADQVNFVMLNVDNSKWLPEISEFEVDGIPHFVFLNATGEALASTIGQQPRQIMSERLAALVENDSLSTAPMAGQTSPIQPMVKAKADDPRGHGGIPVKQSRNL